MNETRSFCFNRCGLVKSCRVVTREEFCLGVGNNLRSGQSTLENVQCSSSFSVRAQVFVFVF